jgi:hypothetical protein
MSRTLITLGVILVILGSSWPLLGKLGLGRLSGDITIERDGFRLYLPLTTSLLVSLIATAVVWWLRRGS